MIPMFACVLPVIVLFCGLALDTGLIELKTLQMQNAADAAAVGAELEAERGTGNWVAQGKADAGVNGFTDGVNGATVSVVQLASSGAYSGHYDSLQATADNVKSLTGEAVRGHGAVAALVSDPKVGSQVRGAVSAVAATTTRIQAGEGVLGRLVNSDADAKRIDDTLANLDTVASNLAQAKGTLGALINDPEIAERLKVLLDQAGSLVSDVRRNPQRYVKLQVF